MQASHTLCDIYLAFIFLIIMAPARVSPEENYPEQNDPFAIPVATQDRIYASLDYQVSQQEKTPEGSGFGLQRILSQWFPHGLLWTPDDGDGNQQESNHDLNLVETSSINPTVVEVESATTTATTGRTSFHNILQSLQEGDRLLEEDFDDDNATAQSSGSDSSSSMDNRLGLGDTTTSRSFKHIRKRRFASDSSSDLEYDMSLPLADTICNGIPSTPNKNHEEISCYTCSSSITDSDPQCDHRLWKYLRHSEKFNLRNRCGRASDYVCMKKVSRRFGERLTERGCVSTPIMVQSGDGFRVEYSSSPTSPLTLLDAKGCYTHSQEDGFLTTSCFCANSLCNKGHTNGPPRLISTGSSLFSMFAICLALLLYGLAFAFFRGN